MDTLIDTAVGDDIFSDVTPKQISWERLSKNLSEPEIGKKEGSMFMLAKIPSGPCKDEYVEHVSAVVFDIDNKISPALTALQIQDKLTSAGLKSIVNSTYNHTASAPRFRLIIAIDEPILPGDYRSICQSVANKLGITEYIDKACLHPSRRYFIPRCPKKNIDEYEFIEVEGGPLVTADFMSNITPASTKTNGKQLTPLTQSLIEAGGKTVQLIEEWLSCISADCDYETWRNIIWSVLSADFDSAEQVARAWSESAPHRFEEKDFVNVVESFDPTKGITLGTLSHYATEVGWTSAPNDSSNEAINSNRYKLLGSADIHALPETKQLLKSIFPAQGFGLIYGPSQSGKSFLAFDMAAAVAQGKKWFGIRVTQTPVIYIILEGEAGLKKRIEAWEKANNQPIPPDLHIVIQPFKLTELIDAQDLAAAVPRGSMIIVDTLNRAAPTMDENSSRDMGTVLENIKILQQFTEGLVVAVHHTGKDESRGARGHSSLFAAMDGAIEVKRNQDTRSWSVAKSKDGEDGREVPFKLAPHDLDKDSDGDPRSSCTVELDAGHIFQKPGPTGSAQKAALKIAKQEIQVSASTGKAGAGAQAPCIKIEDLIAAIASTLATVVKNKRSNRARTIVKGLCDNGHLASSLENDEGWVWLP